MANCFKPLTGQFWWFSFIKLTHIFDCISNVNFVNVLIISNYINFCHWYLNNYFYITPRQAERLSCQTTWPMIARTFKTSPPSMFLPYRSTFLKQFMKAPITYKTTGLVTTRLCNYSTWTEASITKFPNITCRGSLFLISLQTSWCISWHITLWWSIEDKIKLRSTSGKLSQCQFKAGDRR